MVTAAKDQKPIIPTYNIKNRRKMDDYMTTRRNKVGSTRTSTTGSSRHPMITRSKKSSTHANSHHMITRSKTAANKNNNKTCKRKREPPAPFVPLEIMEDILKFLGVRCLLRFKCLSKQLLALIQDPQFIHKHACHGPVDKHYYKEKDVECIHCYDGLMLERRRNGSETKYRVTNPAIRQVFDLPDPPEMAVAMSISYSPSSACYKVIALHPRKNGTGSEVGRIGILALGSVDDEYSWRSLEVPSDLHLRAFDGVLLRSFKGVVHVLRFTRPNSEEDCELVYLDLEKECVKSTIFPTNLIADWRQIYSVDYAVDRENHCFALVERVKNELHVLILEDYEKGEWTEKEIKIPPTCLKAKKSYKRPEGFQDYVWFSYAPASIQLSYTIQNHEIISKICWPQPLRKASSVYAKSSLVTFKGMRPEYNG